MELDYQHNGEKHPLYWKAKRLVPVLQAFVGASDNYVASVLSNMYEKAKKEGVAEYKKTREKKKI